MKLMSFFLSERRLVTALKRKRVELHLQSNLTKEKILKFAEITRFFSNVFFLSKKIKISSVKDLRSQKKLKMTQEVLKNE